MRTACLIHWNAEEAKARIAILRRCGFSAIHVLPRGMASLKEIADRPPAVIVIDLSRLPSQGRDIAIILRRNGKTRHVPLVFTEGERQKVASIKKHLPDAIYISWKVISTGLKRALRKPKANVVVPNSSLAGYSGTPLPTKLGIKPGSTAALIDAPDDFENTLGKLPENVALRRNPRGRHHLTLWFTTSLHEYRSRIKSVAALTERIWIIWPKHSSGVPTDLSERDVREVGLGVGLVDYKVCAVDSTWSGLLFTRRKAGKSLRTGA